MLDAEKIKKIIIEALENINDERSSDEKINFNLDICLFGPDGVLDSLALVSMIVDVEGAFSDFAGRDISLTDDRAINQEESPFENIQKLTDYILLLLSENSL